MFQRTPNYWLLKILITLSWQRSLSYRNHCTDLQSKILLLTFCYDRLKPIFVIYKKHAIFIKRINSIDFANNLLASNFSIANKWFKLFLLFSHLGILTHFVASLLEMSDWGGTDAESLKKGTDSIFLEDGKIPATNYETKLVSLTTDGASVNTGRISGLMIRFALGENGWFKFIESNLPLKMH